MEDIEQSRRLTDRRSFLLKGAAVGAGAIGASRLLTASAPPPPMGASRRGTWPFSSSWPRPSSSRPTCGSSTTSSAGSRTANVPGGTGNKAYTRALSVLDKDIPQYIHDNADDEQSHANFINAYLEANGADPINLDKFRTLPSSKATGARQIGRLTNLMELTIDTSWWTRYRSDSKNPDLGDTLPQAVPDLAVGKHPAIPRSDDDLTPRKHLQAIAEHGRLPLRHDRAGRHEPLRLARAASDEPRGAAHLAQHRPHGNDALPDVAGQGRQRSAADRPQHRADVPRPERARRAVQAQPDHARADEIPRSEVPDLLDHPAHQTPRALLWARRRP